MTAFDILNETDTLTVYGPYLYAHVTAKYRAEIYVGYNSWPTAYGPTQEEACMNLLEKVTRPETML
jgi:hypothetical protein